MLNKFIKKIKVDNNKLYLFDYLDWIMSQKNDISNI